MKKFKQKLYVIRKYVMASSASGAIKKEKNQKVDDVWIDDDYKRNMTQKLEPAIGFEVPE